MANKAICYVLTTASPQVVQGVELDILWFLSPPGPFSAMNNSDHILKLTLE